MRKLIAGLSCLLLLIGLEAALPASEAIAVKSSFTGLSAEMLSQPGLPIQLGDVSADSNIITREISITYSLRNNWNQPLKGVSVFLILLDQERNALAAERIRARVEVDPGERYVGTQRLSNLLYINPNDDYGRIVVAVEGANGGSTSWKLSTSLAELHKAVKTGTPLPAQLTPIESADTPCNAETSLETCANYASTFSGTRGVKRFSCSVGLTCTCAFAYKGMPGPVQ